MRVEGGPDPWATRRRGRRGEDGEVKGGGVEKIF